MTNDLRSLPAWAEMSPEPQTDTVASLSFQPFDADVARTRRLERDVVRAPCADVERRPSRIATASTASASSMSIARSPEPDSTASNLSPQYSSISASPEPFIVSLNSALSTASNDRSPEPIMRRFEFAGADLVDRRCRPIRTRELQPLDLDLVDRQVARSAARTFEAVALDACRSIRRRSRSVRSARQIVHGDEHAHAVVASPSQPMNSRSSVCSTRRLSSAHSGPAGLDAGGPRRCGPRRRTGRLTSSRSNSPTSKSRCSTWAVVVTMAAMRGSEATIADEDLHRERSRHRTSPH